MLQDIVLVFRWLMLASGILLGASISLSDLRAKQGQTLLLGFGPAKLRFAMVASLAALMFTLIAEMAIRSWLQYQAFAAGGPGQYLIKKIRWQSTREGCKPADLLLFELRDLSFRIVARARPCIGGAGFGGASGQMAQKRCLAAALEHWGDISFGVWHCRSRLAESSGFYRCSSGSVCHNSLCVDPVGIFTETRRNAALSRSASSHPGAHSRPAIWRPDP